MPCLFLGYGSLQSARGLGRQLEGLRDVRPQSLGVRRFFQKPAQRSGCLAMDLELEEASLKTSLEVPEGSTRAEGLLLEVADEQVPALVRREGYAPACWERVVQAAGVRGPAAFLLDLARGKDVPHLGGDVPGSGLHRR